MKLENNEINILVLGDIMLDHYIYCESKSIEKEAQIPLFKEVYNNYMLGGAGNIINILHHLGVNVITCLTYDNPILNTLMSDVCPGFYYTKKSYNPVIRTKYESIDLNTLIFSIIDENITSVDFTSVIDDLNKLESKIDCIIISDHGKGTINGYYNVFSMLQELFNDKPVFIDPYPKNINLYDNCHIIFPNDDEYNEIISHKYCSMCFDNIRYTIKTMGKFGMELLNARHDMLHFQSSKEYNIFNKHSAKDMLISIMAVCHALYNKYGKYNKVNNTISIIDHMKISEKCIHYIIKRLSGSYLPRSNFNRIIKKY